MKIFFASLSDLSLEVDAWVPTHAQGLVLIKALAETYKNHVAVVRARLKRYHDYEERFVGSIDSTRFDEFMRQVEHMGEGEKS